MERPFEPYSKVDVETNKDVQRTLFEHMLRELEDIGRCRDNYHTLAGVLFGDTLHR